MGAFVYEPALTVRLSDGTRLAAAAYLPVTGRAPALLVRTPYGISSPQVGMAGNGAGVLHPTSLVDAGFAVIWVECRGTFGSEGRFRPLADEAADGYDTVEWIVSQPWSNGIVGMYGASYLGITQWAVAAAGHPAVYALAPMFTSMRGYHGAWHHPGGALSLSAVTSWTAMMSLNDEIRLLRAGEGSVESVMAIGAALADQLSINDALPVAANPLLATSPNFGDFIGHAEYDEFWEIQDFSGSLTGMTAPVLMTAGWYDVFVGQQLREFERYCSEAGSVEAREGSRLIVGPWDHDPGLAGHYRDRDFGVMSSAVAADTAGEHLSHFRRWMNPEGAPSTDGQVRLFVMGSDTWREFSSWPPAESLAVDFFLTPGKTGGALVPRPADVEHEYEYEYEYEYDPAHPVPSAGGAQLPASWGFSGPVDQRRLGVRPDILTFVTEPLDEDVEVIGYVSATLFVRSDRPDTDFTAKLIDVAPDGTALGLCDGILRMRYRESLSDPKPVEPGRVYEIVIDMAATGTCFRAGHRIRLDVSSSNFPRFDRNSNTGNVIVNESLAQMVVARNGILTGSQYPSRLSLPHYDVDRTAPGM